MFTEFTHFVILHYALSARNDTPYWKELLNKDYDWELLNPNITISSGMRYLAMDRMSNNQFQPNGGPHCVAAGLNWHPIDRITEKLDINKLQEEQVDFIVQYLDKRKALWKERVKNCQTLYDYLKGTIYKDNA